MRLLFLVPLGYIAAVVTAALVMVAGTFGVPDAGSTGFFAGTVLATTPYVGAAAFVPAVIAIVISELTRLRGPIYFLAAGAAIGFAGDQFAGLFDPAALLEAQPLHLTAAGLVGGFVYWLIAAPPAAPSD